MDHLILSFRNIALFFVLGVLALSGCTKTKPSDELIIGFSPAESVEAVEANGKVLAEIIKSQTQLKLKTFIASDYAALIEAMRSGRVHLAFLPPFSYVQAEKIAGAKVLLKSVRKGHAYFHSAIITGKDIKSLQGLKGKTIAWTDPASASGHIIPKSALMEKGIDPDQFFSKQVYAGGHDALVLAVVNGTVDAGATFSNDADGQDGAWTQFLKDPEQRKKVKVLFVSKPIPGDTLSTTEKFYKSNQAVVDQVVSTLLNLGKTPDGRKVLQELYRIDSMEVATSPEYDPVRDAAKRLNVTNL